VSGARAKIIGGAAERAVVAFLSDNGCEILGVNVRVDHLELDVVARLGQTVLIVEVRSRSAGAWVPGLASVDLQKRARVRAAGERLWDRKLKHDVNLQHLRFDVASVSFDARGTAQIEYVPAAF
jgi:putative endonuclease